MTPLEEILDLLDMEIHFYQESSPPEEYAKFCVVEIQTRGAE